MHTISRNSPCSLTHLGVRIPHWDIKSNLQIRISFSFTRHCPLCIYFLLAPREEVQEVLENRLVENRTECPCIFRLNTTVISTLTSGLISAVHMPGKPAFHGTKSIVEGAWFSRLGKKSKVQIFIVLGNQDSLLKPPLLV